MPVSPAQRRLPLRVRTRAASVLHSALRVLALTSDEPIEVAAVPCATSPGAVVEARTVVAPLIRDFLDTLIAATSKAAQCASDAVLQTYAVRILGLLLLFFPDAVGHGTGRVLQTLFQLMASLESVYVQHAGTNRGHVAWGCIPAVCSSYFPRAVARFGSPGRRSPQFHAQSSARTGLPTRAPQSRHRCHTSPLLAGTTRRRGKRRAGAGWAP